MLNSNAAAMVTGANKGIGLGIVRELCRQFTGTVYLTARDAERGVNAVQQLKEEGLKAKFLQLDVTDVKSIESVRDFLQKEHGGLDILVNNAGIFAGRIADPADESSYSVEALRSTMATNFTGLLDVCKIIFPILRPHARVVNVSSSLGSLRHLNIPALKERLISTDLSVQEIEQIAADYLQAADKGNPSESGYPSQFGGSYIMSKILVTALTRVQQRNFDKERKNEDIVVNAVCPGFVATDLNQHRGHRTIEQGADTPSYLALLPPQQNELVHPRGEVVSERVVKAWTEDL